MWVRQQYPGARVFSVSGDPHFHLTRARNIGAANARGTFLLFVDADIALEGDLGEWIATHARLDHFYTASNPRSASLIGTVVCDRQVFDQVGGYDEAFRGWDWEDYDLYHRFAALPLREAHFGSEFLRSISLAIKKMAAKNVTVISHLVQDNWVPGVWTRSSPMRSQRLQR
jgi:glycosyltransferase involved in cell wall biosynthesis